MCRPLNMQVLDASTEERLNSEMLKKKEKEVKVEQLTPGKKEDLQKQKNCRNER